MVVGYSAIALGDDTYERERELERERERTRQEILKQLRGGR
jgi:hypothetical protein